MDQDCKLKLSSLNPFGWLRIFEIVILVCTDYTLPSSTSPKHWIKHHIRLVFFVWKFHFYRENVMMRVPVHFSKLHNIVEWFYNDW